MTPEIVIDIAKDTIYTIIVTSAPLLLISLVVGLIISIIQTATSIQEQTLTFVPKVLCIFLAMMIFGSWMLNNIVEFMVRLWSNFSLYVG
ncbi:flagellar biosynthesis protein FliQ [Candidatus Galacturonibacter soehngenii]|uniref:Flagellar biosynthetic protein FliQ n=1 Tax=Candidatus Galacturonatibacter soehngenii TaxID=2307010 RepID=A0A7V7QLB0_9FIRM|nr:flagellar biosynthesis protein FliQ [Candidatus Galacturonibacter soehngenii]KAB1438714.1 flagellar biosynthesis protein FliQ [Candidatus Galacturonibacter soehngenii]MBA4686924.1 flagellar biosynthesis protein FliQ [Candidatus Galacturonibacter soehngenii]